MLSFIQPSEHQVLVFLVQIVILLAVARLLGQLCRSIGQPSVVGELAAGVILGPSILGRGAPDVFDWIFPGDAVQSGMLFTVGWLGVMLLLVVTGFETDLTLIARLGRAAFWVTAGSLLFPFAFGLAGGALAPDSLVGADTDRQVFALFLATALTISSLPVIAKILTELRLLRRNFGQLTLACGMANDVIGWVLLGLIAGLASSGRLDLRSLLTTVAGLVVFLAIAAAVGQRIVDAVLQAMRRRNIGLGGWVTMSIILAIGLGAITQALGVEAVLGAFIGGILLGRSRYARHDVEEQLETITVSFLAPIFFATAGLRVDISLLGDPEVLLWTFIVIALATASKFVGSMLGARVAGLDRREGMALGTALNARGALEIVIATVGLSLGVLNDASYAIVVVMAIVTSVMAPPLLRMLVRGWAGSPEEQARLKREEQMAANLLLKPGRILIPTRGGVASRYVASIVGSGFPPEAPVTLMIVGDDAKTRDVSHVEEALGPRLVEHVRISGDPSESVVSQSVLGFDVVASGLAPTPDAAPIGPISSAALTGSRLPVVLVRPPRSVATAETPRVPRFRRILLPVSAARPSRAAAELAVAVAAASGATLYLLHVSAPRDTGPVRRIIRTTLRSHERIVASYADPVGERLIDAAERNARENGVEVRRVLVNHQSRGGAIVEAADDHRCDLIMLGVEVQDAAGEPFLGQTAEVVLSNSDASIALVALPSR
ncbi:MAG: cation:proton antiporter [Ilumatobacter sp.]|nr:MAG: cation:proton antiporter [Ilumatobacter sp.]